MQEPVFISYRTETTEPRRGLLGDGLRFVSRKPLLSGLVIGISANVLALIRAPGVVESAPVEAAVLGLGVLLVITGLFSRMGPFFALLAVVRFDVVRALTYDGHLLQWMEGETVRVAIQNPKFGLFATPPPPEVLEDARARSQPWDVNFVAWDEDREALLTIETKLSAEEAAGLRPADPEFSESPDETLPPHVLAPLLLIARNKA